jgi:hypothetical protein
MRSPLPAKQGIDVVAAGASLADDDGYEEAYLSPVVSGLCGRAVRSAAGLIPAIEWRVRHAAVCTLTLAWPDQSALPAGMSGCVLASCDPASSDRPAVLDRLAPAPGRLIVAEGGGLSVEGREKEIGCRVGPSPASFVCADEPGGLWVDGQGVGVRVVKEGEAGDKGYANTSADQRGHEPVIAGAAGDLGPEATCGGQRVQNGAGVAPALHPAVLGEVGQGDR